MTDQSKDLSEIISRYVERMSLLAEFMMSFPGFIAVVINLEDNPENFSEINRLSKGFLAKRDAIARWHKKNNQQLDPRTIIMVEWLTLFKDYKSNSFLDKQFRDTLDSILSRLEKMEIEFQNKQESGDQ